MDSETIPRDFKKDGFAQLSEQGDSIGHTEVYNEVYLMITSTIKY